MKRILIIAHFFCFSNLICMDDDKSGDIDLSKVETVSLSSVPDFNNRQQGTIKDLSSYVLSNAKRSGNSDSAVVIAVNLEHYTDYMAQKANSDKSNSIFTRRTTYCGLLLSAAALLVSIFK